MKKILLTLSLSLASGLVSGMAQADDCDFPANNGHKNFTINLITPNITVGADVPVGTIIHRQRLRSADSFTPQLVCHTSDSNNPFPVQQFVSLTNTQPLVPGWTGNYPGAVYQTSVPGIGVAVINEDGYDQSKDKAINGVPLQKWEYPSTEYGDKATLIRNQFSLAFIKTGPIGPGIINGTQLPTVVLNVSSNRPVTGLPKEVFRENFAGSINVVAGTCKTSDVNVPMGSYGLDKYFNGKTSNTPWKGFLIYLHDCPVFHGTYTNIDSPPLYNIGGSTQAGLMARNYFEVQILPTFGVVDVANGIFNLSNEENSASGIAIQMATGQQATPIDLSKVIKQEFLSTGESTQAIVLLARYIQTGTTVTPGKANSKAMFTISYH
ncbi:fimbrial protein [Pantoea dispersa]|uniref:fimbrial protein n=1 Tax=Pantoea dispersa TaxID=59814 RepID=UPI002DB68C84|nr:fimbrial protein [Pantoea dispersa]MEB5971283.1 type 1 fimbrial protein [Pantoea dispersa]